MVVWIVQFKCYGDVVILVIQDIMEWELVVFLVFVELVVQVVMSEWILMCCFVVVIGSNLRCYVVVFCGELVVFLLCIGCQLFDYIVDECGYGSVSVLSCVFFVGYGCSFL